ncbi:hypothetical protein LWI29_025043 [Acer saccharum]|uniref:Uncharacterized protein n=1 Tax=Acer saccharum TaxID=4024 RepID=A0AA39RLK0_ACESA|nr:hypothetical protein LWI29_025043 [Acer saccharum]
MTQATEALSRNLQQTKRRKAYQFQLLVISKSDDQLWASPVADRARKLVQQVTPGVDRPRTRPESQILVFPVADRALKQVQNRMLAVVQLLVMTNVISQKL